jgi:microcystin-dependent protein
MGFLEDLKNGDIKSIILVIFGVLIFYQYWCLSSVARSIKENQCKDTKELMSNVSQDIKSNVSNDIKEAVKQVYLADVEAIRNLSEVATKLQASGLTIPGNLTVTGSFNYLPKGSIIVYNGNVAPPGWTLCDGSNGSPDLRGRFVLGNGGSKGFNTTGGEENVTLGIPHMPHHNHNVNGTTSSNGAHQHGFGVGGGGGNSGSRGTTQGYLCHNCAFHASTDAGGNHNHTFNADSSHVGGNQAHNNMPPFYVLTYIMKL